METVPAGKLRLAWRHTWLDSTEDFVARSDRAINCQVGRIYSRQQPGGPDKIWLWFAYGRIADTAISVTATGQAPSKMEAALELEARWFAALGEADATAA